jgi:hypothetical protein
MDKKEMLINEIKKIDRKHTDKCIEKNTKLKWFYEYHHELMIRSFREEPNNIKNIEEYLFAIKKENDNE